MKKTTLFLATFAVALGISAAQTPVPQQPNTPQQGTPQQNLPQTPNPNDPTRQGMPPGRNTPDATPMPHNGKMNTKGKMKKKKKGMTDPMHPDAMHPDATSPSKL
jgi:hypothetical protein